MPITYKNKTYTRNEFKVFLRDNAETIRNEQNAVSNKSEECQDELMFVIWNEPFARDIDEWLSFISPFYKNVAMMRNSNYVNSPERLEDFNSIKYPNIRDKRYPINRKKRRIHAAKNKRLEAAMKTLR